MYLTQSLRRAIQICGDSVATICAERQRSWPQVGERVERLAGALAGLGIGEGDRVAILAQNSDRYLEYMFAVPWVGAVFVPINTRLAPPEVAYWLNDSGAEVLFIDDQFLPVLEALEGQLETVRAVVYMGDGETPAGLHDYEAILAAADAIDDAGRCDDDLAGIYYTGGTTGRSKGVMLSHRNLMSNGIQVAAALRLEFGPRWLHAAPMFHIADSATAFTITMVGGSHVFIPGFAPEACLDAIQDHRVTRVLLVPTMVNMLLNHPGVENYDLSSLINVVYGASPMPEALIVRAMEVLPDCEFSHGYGMTECAPVVAMNGPEYHVLEGPNAGKLGSIGRAVVGVEVKVIDTNGDEVPRGTVGELCARGANVMRGYWGQPELTEKAIRDGWMHTGDGAWMDDDGFVYIVDRMKDMIITGGENVYSTEVENVIYDHPDVAECAVIGIPDETWGEAVHAIVRLRDGASVEADAIIAHCSGQIAGFKCPRGVTFRDQPMPLSGAGKILKTELRAPFWEEKSSKII